MKGAEAIALESARVDDAEAFRMLVEQNSHKMFRLAFRMTGNEQDAEDVVQETFLRAYRHIGRYDARARVSTWLYTIASNCAIDLLRKRRRRRTESLDHTEARAPAVADGPGPDRSMFGVEVRDRIEAELEKLSAKERAAFTLRHFEGQSIREISEIMGTPEGSVKNNIFRAVRKLRSTLEPALGAER
jgi:RNA polymerase sigma-70 factor (ECF subfamily)